MWEVLKYIWELYGTGSAEAVVPRLALLKRRRLFGLQAIASSVRRKGEEPAGLSLLFTTQSRHSSVCEGENSVLSVQEKESAQWL